MVANILLLPLRVLTLCFAMGTGRVEPTCGGWVARSTGAGMLGMPVCSTMTMRAELSSRLSTNEDSRVSMRTGHSRLIGGQHCGEPGVHATVPPIAGRIIVRNHDAPLRDATFFLI